MNLAVVGLGSNIDPERHIQQGKEFLASTFNVLKFSRFLRTIPQNNPQQAEFINGGALIETPLSFSQVKETLKGFEIQMGRTLDMHNNKPRVIDFDIHLWNDEIVDPFFYRWDFLRKIVLELVPDLRYDHGKVVWS